MSKKLDLHVKELSYIKQDKFVSSQLTLELDGKDMHYVIANTLRRASYDDIPTYAFEYVNIEHSNSKAHDNDMMVVHLRQLPVYDMENELDYLHPRYWQDVDYSAKDRDKPEGERAIEATINAYNNTNDKVKVTTKDLAYYIDGKQVEYPNRHSGEPILLIELLPNQTFKCQMKAFLGVGERDSIWFAAKDTFYDYEFDNPNKITFTIESAGQIPEYTILIKCCRVIRIKLDSIGKEIDHRVKARDIKPAPTIFFDLINEDYTMGNLINNALQDHPHIAFSGVSQADRMIRAVRFKIQCTDDVDSPIGPLFEALEYLKNVYTALEDKFVKLRK
jgi:DNA-directed RNA polymerase subunit L